MIYYEDLVNKILNASDPYIALNENVIVKNNEIKIKDSSFNFKKLLAIAIGKASLKMIKWAIEKLKPIKSIVVTLEKDVKLDNVEVIESTHPNPTEKSIEAAKRIIEALKYEDYDLALFLISGGSSAMVELPTISLEDYIKTNKVLLKSKLNIHQINIVRKHLSKIKGGRLALYSKSPIISLIVSDVLENDPSAVGSGPTCEDNSTFKDAYQIVKVLSIPNSAKNYIIRGMNGEYEDTPKYLPKAKSFIILDNMSVLKKIKGDLDNSLILTSQLNGESREVAKCIASIVNSIIDYGILLKRPCNLILGGEPYVNVKGKGKGGRNSEFALSFLESASKKAKWKLLAFATDGIDGNSDYAGCIATSEMELENINDYFENNDTYSFFEKYNSVIKTGKTGTNVNNVYVISIDA
jgi:Putative glycerate kinase